MSKVEASTADPYARITGCILEQLEQGVRPWTKPWNAEHLGGHVTRPLRATGEPYQGINVLLLCMEAVVAGHPSPTWFALRQRECERTTPAADRGGRFKAESLAQAEGRVSGGRSPAEVDPKLPFLIMLKWVSRGYLRLAICLRLQDGC